MVPSVALQLVAPTEVNCCVAPATTVARAGVIVCVAGATSATAAEAEPFGPVAVTVAEAPEGIVLGAVNSPVELTVPAEVDQLVAPDEVNCCVMPRVTVAEVGEIV